MFRFILRGTAQSLDQRQGHFPVPQITHCRLTDLLEIAVVEDVVFDLEAESQ